MTALLTRLPRLPRLPRTPYLEPRLGRGGGGPGGQARHRSPGDLTVLADDPLKVADTDLAELPVLLTLVGGRVTYRGAVG
ncbi:hypothetical protein [Streptomyces sp. NPDC007856]|uniref:hypothetical protein n=1 Tax=Streptomyces sp. NPDC007856 TaxID=3364781 RepID=UPI00368A8D17